MKRIKRLALQASKPNYISPEEIFSLYLIPEAGLLKGMGCHIMVLRNCLTTWNFWPTLIADFKKSGYCKM